MSEPALFGQLHPLMRSLLKKEGITIPTEPQIRSMGHILRGEHTLIIGPTGIGKTEAAVIPVFQSLLCSEKKGKGFRALYITPLRALNRDMTERLRHWGEHLSIPVGLRHGDTPRSERRKQSLDPPSFLITTPETLQILFTGSRLARHLKSVEYVVVDEIHDICPNVRGAQLAVALERLDAVSGGSVRIGLSATVGLASVPTVGAFLGGVGRRVKIVRMEEGKELDLKVTAASVSEDVREKAADLGCSEEETSWILAALDLIKRREPVLFFVNTRQTAEVLASRIALLDPDIEVGIHHGSLSKEVRMKMEGDFKSGALKGLICTSSLELGIDVGFVEHVIQFSSPREVTRLVQRVGRAGHGVDRVSRGTVLATKKDDLLESGVICRRAQNNELEEIRILKEPLAVLANQIMAASMGRERGEEELYAGDLYRKVKGAFPYSELKKATYYRLLEELNEMYLINFYPDSDVIRRKRKTLRYFYDNISMLRDEKTFYVIDLVTGRCVGKLNEGFVVTQLKEGVKFIVKGRPWAVLEIEDERITVAPSDDIGAIPSWIGEEIPVPYEVAREVGEIRRRIRAIPDIGEAPPKDADEALKELLGKYRLDESSRAALLGQIRDQIKNFELPTSEKVTLERRGTTAVVNTAFGTRTNETLALIISSLIAARIGRGVETSTDAYRIVLSVPRPYPTREIKGHLLGIPPGGVGDMVRILIKNSPLSDWTLLYVAKKFGAVRSDADFKKVNMRYLSRAYKDSLIRRETVRFVLHNYFDADRAAEVIGKMRSGAIEVVTATGISPMARDGLEEVYALTLPVEPDSSVLKALKARLLRLAIVLICMHCRSSFHKMPGDVPERESPTCPVCGGTFLAMVRDHRADLAEVVKKPDADRTPEERKKVRRLEAAASLVKEYKRRGVLALLGRGVGPQKAADILAKPFTCEEEFLREILRAERQYARTRRFWD